MAECPELSWLSPFAANITDVTLVAAQLLWQYFVPSSLVAALDHKRHLAPNTNINSLPLLIKHGYNRPDQMET